jgi:hypothetical protein
MIDKELLMRIVGIIALCWVGYTNMVSKKDEEESSPIYKPPYVFSPIVAVGIILVAFILFSLLLNS